MAIALDTGVVPLGNMEAVQFHPTGVVPGDILVTEGCRGDGGYLLDKDEHRFMLDYEPEKKELASRDVVSRRMVHHMRQGHAVDTPYGPHLWLDIRHLGREHIEKNLRDVQEICRDFLGLDPVDSAHPGAAYPALQHGRRPHRHRRARLRADRPLRRGRGRLLGPARLQPAGRQLTGRDHRHGHGGREDRCRGPERLGVLLLRRPGALRPGAGGGAPRSPGLLRPRVRVRPAPADVGRSHGEGGCLPQRRAASRGRGGAAAASPAGPAPGAAFQRARAEPRGFGRPAPAGDAPAGHHDRLRGAAAHREPRQPLPGGLSGAERQRMAQANAGRSGPPAPICPTSAYEPVRITELPPGERGYGEAQAARKEDAGVQP